ncbi:hypothetical protein, partial [Escherichia coli]|uniref:hypothetical protein n=1 Tax=Escherichia coli TaxID=562 RepID=UPI0013C2EFA3
SETVRINWKTENGTALATGTTNATGRATLAFRIPSGSSGWTDCVATGVASGAQAYGAVEVTGGTPPPTPSPIAGSNPSYSGSVLP